jgi:hypothetical protein
LHFAELQSCHWGLGFSMAGRNDKPALDAGLSEAQPHYHGHRERLRARFRAAM